METSFEILRLQLREAVEECAGRGLVFAAKWAAEQLCGLSVDAQTIPSTIGVAIVKTPTVAEMATTPTLKHRLRGASRQLNADDADVEQNAATETERARRERWSRQDASEKDRVLLAKCLFDLREFDRAAYKLQDCTGPRARFLRLYSQYLSRERHLDESRTRAASDSAGQPPMPTLGADRELISIRDELEQSEKEGNLDSFGYYLLAMVLKSLGQRQLAREACVRSLSAYEYNWSAWILLESCIDPHEPMDKLSGELPGGWMRHAFFAHMLLEVFGANSTSSNSNGDEFSVHCQVLEQLFPQSQFVIGLRAVRHYNMREFEEARQLFSLLQRLDPYQLELADIHSNILYVMEDRARLSALAHRCSELDRFRPETCCVIGNYFSLRREHEKAVGYFQRALQLDQNYLAAWTLMGHEYIEMKNTAAAIDAYRHAVDVDDRDYRAWYGLGQTYEMLNMPHYATSYYMRAAALRPYDSRMWCALGNCYELSAQRQQAIECYRRALIGSAESECLAISRLARLYESTDERKLAAYYYQLLYEYALKNGAQALGVAGTAAEIAGGASALHGGQDELAAACLFLAAFENDRGRKQVAQRYLAQVIDGASSGGASQQRVDDAKAMMHSILSS
ncbi:Anaphase-promoting complex subunit 8 [Coemansia sp. RSA 2703]|nr:Anaphase-promoting complex subunit 8 [Coemansia sp. RSA 2703]KAJ2375992.1 Anaphase-promoting complex subunit 8 [Coemansia sp. RSA 2607]KAJ2398116.1 Anaphase-promoting complex subunit 8 [Coemansia sp. RSA 2603]